ncbi:MAG: hypothetical protein JSU95_09530 [Betaproteobacteria bacterium]|nr:MAG: hypothetical protein JSU95_09530 [Betaproteobacteria bacterium]
MIKRILSTFLNSYAESLKLQDRYRSLVTRLGWLTVAISCLALVFVMYHAWLLFGLPLEGGSVEGWRLRLISWVIVVVALVPVMFFAGMVLGPVNIYWIDATVVTLVWDKAQRARCGHST